MGYLEELEKIANSTMNIEDAEMDPMTEDPQPAIPAEEVEAQQMANAEEAEDLAPASPEDTENLEAAVEEAGEDLQALKESLAHAEENFAAFEKTAQEVVFDRLPEYGALAKLIDYSTSEGVDDSLKKLASDRLTQAFQSEDDYNEVIVKTAGEIFEDEENRTILHSDDGVNYVMEHLAAFSGDDELEKAAFEMGSIFAKVRERAGEAVDAVQNYQKLKDEVNSAKSLLDQTGRELTQAGHNFDEAKKMGDYELAGDLGQTLIQKKDAYKNALNTRDELATKQRDGQMLMGGGVAGLVGGGALAGKKIHDHVKKDPEEELSMKTASDTINQEEVVNETKGGNLKMANSIVNDFLKVAGAAYLVDVANNEQLEEPIRKEASETFNAIARMGRQDMEDNFVKVAQNVYSEDQLHEVVAGNHTEELFEKIAFFTEDVYNASADELEKTAGADGVAAKGVAGALTDAKKNIEEKVQADKKKTEEVAKGETGTKKPDDMRGYNVINNPGEYKVEKTASEAMLEEAELRKEAAYKQYVEADRFIRDNSQVEAE